MDVTTAGEKPIVWNEYHTEGTDCLFFPANRQMPEEQSAKCETTRFPG